MIATKKQLSPKLAKMLLRWLALGLLLASAHAFAQSAGTVTYVYTDPQGTPLAEADASGNITATFDYTPYGTTALGTPPHGPGYTGHVNDPETNLVYMQARYYDPATGHFLSVDPVSISAGNPFDFNRYDYAKDNPIENIDPSGKYSCGDGHTCAIVRQFVAAMHTSLDNLKMGSSDYAKLRRVSAYVGSENDKKGPTYVLGSVPGKGLAQSDQVHTTTIDDSKLQVDSDGKIAPGMKGLIQGGAAIAHEARHDLYTQDNNGQPASSDGQIRDSETAAYGRTNAVLHGYGMTMSHSELQQAINDSVDLDEGKSQQPAQRTETPALHSLNE